MRLSPKFFHIRLALLLAPCVTVMLGVVNFFLVRQCLTDPTTEKNLFWAVLGMVALNLVFGFIAVLAWKTYKELFWKGDKAVWKNSKWRFIKRFLNEPYSK
jgi:hypothetical protein